MKTCIILAGPTAVGKTDIAISLAQHFNTSIISADSRQCYKELNIGVAKPSAEQLHTVPHYFINTHSVTESVTAADYERYALNIAAEIFKKSDTIIIAGGTGLYIKAFCEGLDEIPAVAPEIRNEIIQKYNSNGLEWLQNEIKKNDPKYFAEGEIHNPQRIMRALEVKASTGKSILEFQKGNKKQRDFNIIKILLDLPREILYERINARVDQMLIEGLLDEVRSLIPFRTENALQTVGYSEIFDFIDDKIDLETAIENIKKNTRHYAKRQMTWFKKDEAFNICTPHLNTVLEIIPKI